MFVNIGQAAVKPKNLPRDGKTSIVCLNRSIVCLNRDELRPRFVSVMKRRIATAAIAICCLGAVVIGGSTAGQAQHLSCNNPSTAGLGPGFTWTPAAVCSAVSSAVAATSAVTTIDIAFLTQTSAFVGTPSNPQANQLGSGFWIRGVGGQNTISSTGTATATAGGQPLALSLNGNSQERVNFGGFQVGADLGRFNYGASGLNMVVGITGGLLEATANELTGSGTFSFNVPFVGGYVAATWGNFFGDVLVRDDFYGESVTAANFGLSDAGVRGNAINVTGSAGYRYDIGGWFLEPSVGFIWSHLDLNDPINAPGGNPATVNSGLSGVPPGVFTVNPIDSLIGRAGIRVGTSVTTGNIVFQPFVSASVWNEFASDTTSTFSTIQCPCGHGVPVSLDVSTTRIGTFGQFGLGTAAQILNTGWLGFVRADYRTGENIQGWDLTGGIRYQFAIFTPPPPLVTKN
jgi:Autotransporter beta-domain